MMPASVPVLDVERIRAARRNACLGAVLHYRESTESTNSDAHQVARSGVAEGVAVLAEAQTRGRGRLGRVWVSPPRRNLYLSIVLRPQAPISAAPQLALVAGAAAAAAIRRWCSLAVLKWPNDVLIDGRKVCGILAEMDTAPDGNAYVVIGIGVNLNMADEDFPPELRDKATALQSAIGSVIDRTAFTIALLEELEDRYRRYQQAGFAAIRQEWESLSGFFGRSVTVDDGGRSCHGTALGLDEEGRLRLQLASGEVTYIVSGDVTVVDGYAPQKPAGSS